MSTEIRTSNQSRASTKIVVGAIVVLALLYFGKMFYDNRQLEGLTFAPLTPGKVNLVGVDTAKGGYHIIVANGIAQLVRSPAGAFKSDNSDPGQSESDEGSEKKRVPLRELIQTLQGKSESVGRFVAVLNDIDVNDVRDQQPRWTSAKIQRALSGDTTLKNELEMDLNTHLDGTPLPVFRPSTFDTGIVVLVPVTLDAPTAEGIKKVSGDVQISFETSLMRALVARVKDISSLDKQKMAGYYAEVGKLYLDNPTRRQNVAEALKQITSESNVKSLTELPQTMLDSVQILASDSTITQASYTSQDSEKGKVFNMEVNFTDEGRKRLWKYSQGHMHEQLLLVVDGVAVAAMRIGTELSSNPLTISNLPDESIVKDATDTINQKSNQQ